MRRVASIVGTLFVIALLGPPAAIAQDASPAASQPAAATPAPQATGVPYIDSTGVNHGTITIRAIEDPFTAFDPCCPPAEGNRFVLLLTAFQAADDQQFFADPYAVLLQDHNGYLVRPVTVSRPQPVTVPDFQQQTLAPGDRVSGAIGYSIPSTSRIASILYTPEYNRFIPLQSTGSAEPRAVGEPVDAVDGAGVVHGTVTLKQFEDPFTGFDPTSPPPEGTRYVMLSTVFEAAEDQALWADPAGIVLQDTNGYLLSPTGIRRPPENVVPDLQAQTLAPGDRVSGYVGYVVPTGSQIANVLWSPEAGRLVTLANAPTE
jgi:hypothetical protein